MRFHPSDDQLAVADALQRVLADTLGDRLHALIDGDAGIDRPSWQALMELGLAGLAVPEALGGGGLGLTDLAMAADVLGQAAAFGPIAEHLLATRAIAIGDAAAPRDEWLDRLMSGDAVATLALEGARPEAWTVALADGAITGDVNFVVGGAVADLFVVGTQGGGLALASASQATIATPLRSSDRTRRAARVRFDAAPAVTLAAPGDPAIQALIDAALVLIAADALGGAQRCLDLSVAYAKEREQFGQPIGRFQALKHQLASMALEVEPERAMVWYAAHASDVGLGDATRAAALAKAHLADRFVSVARAAVAAHGAIGYSWEHALNIWLRRSFFDRAMLGSPAEHRARAAVLAGW